jgi:hypothetical protein
MEQKQNQTKIEIQIWREMEKNYIIETKFVILSITVFG